MRVLILHFLEVVMKKIIFTLGLFSGSLFAGNSLFDEITSVEGKVEQQVSYFHGSGRLIGQHGKSRHLISLEIRSTEHGGLFTFNVVNETLSYSRQILLKRAGVGDLDDKSGFQIFTPADDASDLASYQRVGWAHEVEFVSETLGKIRGILLNYTVDGNHVSQHWTVDQVDGMKVLRNTGSVINADGVLHAWADVLRQVL